MRPALGSAAGDSPPNGVNYTGGITWHLKTATGLGYRCVKAAK